jgi:hypothetical protein
MPRTIIAQPFSLLATGAVGTGIADSRVLHEILVNPAAYDPTTKPRTVSSLLSAAEQRRVSDLTRLVLAAAEEACPVPPADLQAIFVTNGGDGVTTHAICDALAAPTPDVSPTRFTNSVHNAAAAYWSIGLHRLAATTSLGAGPRGLSAGLIEAVLTMKENESPVLLVAYDAPYPFPLAERVLIRQSLALAFYLAPASSGPRWQLDLSNESGETLPQALAAHFDGHSCAPGMTWLSVRENPRRVVLPYLDGLSVALEPLND